MYGLYQIMYFTLIDIKNTLLSPFFIVVFLIIYYQYHQIIRGDKNLSNIKKSTLLVTLNATFYGIVGGFITTIAFIYLEVVVIPKDFMYILAVAIVLSLINPRFMCFAYGGSLVYLSSMIIGYPKLMNKNIMIVVATLHLVESLLIFINGNKDHQPGYFENRNGYVGGFNMNRFWPVPFVIFIGDGLIQPITLMAILSYGDYTLGNSSRKTIFTSIMLGLYSISLLMIARSSSNLFIAPLFAIGGHEFIMILNKFIEDRRTPLFSSPLKGVRILEVSRNSVCKDVGIKVGDIIIDVNGTPIYTEKDIEDMELLYTGTYKIVYFNIRKGIRSKTYIGKRKALGISIVPRVQ